MSKQDQDYPKGYCVYLMRNQGYFKIGFTQKLRTRLITMQAGSPTLIEIEHYWKVSDCDEAEFLEKKLHVAYRDNWVRGEWFRFSDEEIDSIKSFDAKQIIDNRSIPDFDFLNKCRSTVVNRRDVATVAKELFKKSPYTNTDIAGGKKREYVSYCVFSNTMSFRIAKEVLEIMGFCVDKAPPFFGANKGKFIVYPNI